LGVAGTWLTALTAATVLVATSAQAQPVAVPRLSSASAAQTAAGDALLLQAREALRRPGRDTAALLVQTRDTLAAQGHPLAAWAAYWELNARLAQAQQRDLDAFWLRWPGTYVEDRLRNDWLLELGQRRDWANFRAEFPRFRMNDDRSVTCYALLTRHLNGENVRSEARTAWAAPRDVDDGCSLLAGTLTAAGAFTPQDIWPVVRQHVEAARLRPARAAAELIDRATALNVADAYENPQRFLQRQTSVDGDTAHELTQVALTRLAASDPAQAVALLEGGLQARLPPSLAALAWGSAVRQAAMKQQPLAAEYVRRAWRQQRRAEGQMPWSDEQLAWQVRAALRLPADTSDRWSLMARAIDAMSPAEQRDPAWVYWRARARFEDSHSGRTGEHDRTAARAALAGIASPLHFYGKMALEANGRAFELPPVPLAPTAAETEAVRGQAGLARALQLIALGLRSEGVREWNWSLRGLGERELLTAAQWACEREVWDRCINTSERTRDSIDITQRYPLPLRDAVLPQAREAGLDPAYIYGLIRQESRFIMDARSHVGASGLMQIMPATARWTARKIGLPFQPAQITDQAVNLKLGTAYLKIVLDDFGGSQALAAAAYNAGPNRPRRWREGAVMEAAAWAETIPFTETRDYVKKVLSNAVVYSAILDTKAAPGLSARLGPAIGPREAAAPATDREIP